MFKLSSFQPVTRDALVSPWYLQTFAPVFSLAFCLSSSHSTVLPVLPTSLLPTQPLFASSTIQARRILPFPHLPELPIHSFAMECHTPIVYEALHAGRPARP